MGEEVIIAGGLRTAMGRFGQGLAQFDAATLGGIVGRAVLDELEVPVEAIDTVIASNARQAGTGPNLGRQLVAKCGLPLGVTGYTVNMACGSGVKAIELAADALRANRARCILVIGVEAMSRIPYLLEGARWGYKLGNGTVHDALYRDGFICALSNQHMGMTAELLATEYGITRGESDAYALSSHERAVRAMDAGKMQRQIVPIPVPQKRSAQQIFQEDQCPRRDTSLEKLQRLQPVFEADGQITAGNASAIADGAAAILMMRESTARAHGVENGLRLLEVCSAGVEPEKMGIGPVPAIHRLLETLELSLDEIAEIEINEAFAVQVLACLRELDLDPARVNRWGGAIAQGHPIGMSGVRMFLNLEDMLARGARGMASLCVNGGMGLAAAVERL